MPETLTTPKPRAAVTRMKEYHPPLGNRSGLRLDFNENTVACSPRVLERLRAITAVELTRYPERAAVEGQVADHLRVKPEEVLLTNGVDEAIHLLCQAYLDRDSAMLLPVPTYSMYEVYASAAEARLDAVPAAKDFAFPVDALLGAIRPETRLIAIANPNSPTGASVAREDILRLAAGAPQAVVLVDEAYFHFFGETMLDCIGKTPNLVVARTFSKAYGLAGLRVGALVAPEHIMQWLRRVISPYSVNHLALVCIPVALADDAYLNWYVAEVQAARAGLLATLTALHVPHWPSGGNFVLVSIGARHREFVEAMRRRGVLTRDRSNDPGCTGCVRITVGTREQMESATQAMSAALEEIEWQPA